MFQYFEMKCVSIFRSHLKNFIAKKKTAQMAVMVQHPRDIKTIIFFLFFSRQISCQTLFKRDFLRWRLFMTYYANHAKSCSKIQSVSRQRNALSKMAGYFKSDWWKMRVFVCGSFCLFMSSRCCNPSKIIVLISYSSITYCVSGQRFGFFAIYSSFSRKESLAFTEVLHPFEAGIKI